jgi:glutathione synthase/RimK-type ligase-like ATP-grasp enzyme
MSRELSDEERAICQTVYSRLDLAFCAIDCLVDRDGTVRVLEVNGNPGIEMLYRDSGSAVAMEVIDFLVNEAIASP